MNVTDSFHHARTATELFNTFGDGPPKTVDLGIQAVRLGIGGFFRGNTVVIGASQNVGKTSFVQMMFDNSKDKGGVASGEDGADVWGARVVAAETGISPSRLRRKDISEAERAEIRTALERLEERSARGLLPAIEVCIGASHERLREVAKKLAGVGCKWAVLDYLQKFKEASISERRIQVSNTLSTWHEACEAEDMVPVALSQVVRMRTATEPDVWNLKESGDLENEARCIILLWRDSMDNLILRGKVAKSSFGGGGIRFAYKFDEREQLIPYEEAEDF